MNSKSIRERINNIMNRGSEKWLSRSLHEDEEGIAKALEIKQAAKQQGVSANDKRVQDAKAMLKQQGFVLQPNKGMRPPGNWKGSSSVPQDMMDIAKNAAGGAVPGQPRKAPNAPDDVALDPETGKVTEPVSGLRSSLEDPRPLSDIQPKQEYPNKRKARKPRAQQASSSLPLNNSASASESDREADKRYGNSKETDLPGESAFVEGLHRILSGDFNSEILEHIGSKGEIPEHLRSEVERFSQVINDVLPQNFLDSGWDSSVAKTIKELLPHLDLSGKNQYLFSKEGGKEGGLRLTNVPQESQDHSYDRFLDIQKEHIGSDMMTEMMGLPSGSNWAEHHDPTDIAMFPNQGAADELNSSLDTLLEEFNEDGDKTKLFEGMNQLKRDMILAKKLYNISLKKAGKEGHHMTRNVSNEEDEKKLKDVKINFDNDNESVSTQFGTNPNRELADLTDNFNLPFDFDDGVYDSQINLPLLIHSGNANLNPAFTHAGAPKFEAAIKDSEAKSGTIPSNWFDNPEINEMMGYENDETFLQEYGGAYEDLGIDPKKLKNGGDHKSAKEARNFNEDEISKIEKLVQEINDHDGDLQLKTRLPEGEDVVSFMKKLIDGDNQLAEFTPENPVNSTSRNVNPYEMDENLSDEQRSQLKETLGGTPKVNYRAIVRNKVRQLRYWRVLQKLESNGKLDDFAKRFIYRKSMKYGSEFSPHIFLG